MLQIDFSSTAIAAVLNQRDPVTRQLRFVSAKTRTLRDYEKRYSSTKGELLALVYGLEKFDWILRPQHFCVETDNVGVKNLRTARMGSNAVLARWLDKIGQFDFTVYYRPGGI